MTPVVFGYSIAVSNTMEDDMEPFETAYAKHVQHFLSQISNSDDDLCECGHDRGSHWDGQDDCGYCGLAGNGQHGCQTFRAAR